MRLGKSLVRYHIGITAVIAVAFSVACTDTPTEPPPPIVISSQDAMSIGALRFTGTIAIIDTTVQVSVIVKNDSTGSVYYFRNCIRDLEQLALYRNAARSGTPVLTLQPPQPEPGCLSYRVVLAPGNSTILRGLFSLSEVGRLVPGIYYVGIPLFSRTASAGTIWISH